MSTIEFNQNFDLMTSALRAFAYNLTKNDDDAKDLYQETAFRAMTNRDKFRTGTNFKAWLYTIMKNIFINNYRKKVKRNTVIDSTDNLYFINSGSTVVRNGSSSNIILQELNTMIEALDPSIRKPFMMHFEGFKYQEIADQLGVPLGTVKSRIFFARKALQQNIVRHYGSVYTARNIA